MQKILIVGGYGRFGSRLARLLCRERFAGQIEIVIAGRDFAKARHFCEEQSARQLVPKQFDRSGNVQEQLEQIGPEIVVDAAGPFQLYGEVPYAVPRAALEVGAHYIDLADDPGFVSGIGCLDELATSRGLFAISGASSVPALSFAAIRALAPKFDTITSYRGGISPSPKARVGISVIKAIASYAGKPISILRNGRAEEAAALIDSHYHTISVGGAGAMPCQRFSLVDVPDLVLAPRIFPEIKNVWFGAAPQPALGHRALTAMAHLVRLGLLPSFLPLARLMEKFTNLAHWGEHRGGMFVELKGTGHDGKPAIFSWELIAEGDDGPYIPSMAAAALISRWLAGNSPRPGARPAHEELELADFQPFFDERAISHAVREHPAS